MPGSQAYKVVSTGSLALLVLPEANDQVKPMCAPGKSDASLLSLSSRFPRVLAAGIISQDKRALHNFLSPQSPPELNRREEAVSKSGKEGSQSTELYGAPME